MSQREFYKDFFITISIAGVITLLMMQWTPLKPYLDFAVICFSFFTALTLIVFIAGDALVKQSNKMLFSYFAMFIILFKLLAAIGIVWGYNSIIQPANKHYVILFIVLYFVFTIFEVKILTKLSKVKTP